MILNCYRNKTQSNTMIQYVGCEQVTMAIYRRMDDTTPN